MRHVLKKGILIALLFTGINLPSGINLAYAADNVNSIKLKANVLSRIHWLQGKQILSYYQFINKFVIKIMLRVK